MLIIAMISLLVIILCVFVFYEYNYVYRITSIMTPIFMVSSLKYIENNSDIDWKLILLGLTFFLLLLWQLHKLQLQLKKKK